MEKFISAESKNALLKLGIYQIVGGVIGVVMIIWAIYKMPELTGAAIILSLILVLFFAYSIFCGAHCTKITERALTYSLVNQALQIVGFEIMGYAFKYVAGVYVTIGIDLTDSFNLTFGAGISKISIDINQQYPTVAVYFNVIAIFIFAWAARLNDKVKMEQEIRKDTRFL